MSQHDTTPAPRHATVHGHVTYRVGDGPDLPIPEGRVELLPAPDSVTLSWTAANGAAGRAALPRSQYEQYVQRGGIVPDDGPH
ncbi:hypothetical protein SAMN05428957_105248 [Oryzisolibacter propanilivorax]|uniref:Uncharacterized protein n=1 Tax=Oryzisolibacter propanilivorax TaxID=1527607 RepID=A0A1G9SZW0_9BURK|nr:hypothetical protein [Oryzisolibacter propanilivorax]SDM41013.1 hypothetical protein SAMN05428957_105248 [Oryzisolibacter propanilivorax]